MGRRRDGRACGGSDASPGWRNHDWAHGQGGLQARSRGTRGATPPVRQARVSAAARDLRAARGRGRCGPCTGGSRATVALSSRSSRASSEPRSQCFDPIDAEDQSDINRPVRRYAARLDYRSRDGNPHFTHNSYPTPSQTRAERRQINDLARTREVRVLSSASEPVVCAVIALRPSSILCRPLPTLRLLPAIPAIRVESHALRPERSVHDPRVFTFYPSMIATARHHPAEARSIFTGRQLSVKPVDGNCSRLCSFSMWQ